MHVMWITAATESSNRLDSVGNFKGNNKNIQIKVQNRLRCIVASFA